MRAGFGGIYGFRNMVAHPQRRSWVASVASDSHMDAGAKSILGQRSLRLRTLRTGESPVQTVYVMRFTAKIVFLNGGYLAR